MVYPPSQGHSVTLGHTRNMQNTTPTDNKSSGVVLFFNIVAGNIPHATHYAWLPCTTQTELMVAKP